MHLSETGQEECVMRVLLTRVYNIYEKSCESL